MPAVAKGRGWRRRLGAVGLVVVALALAGSGLGCGSGKDGSRGGVRDGERTTTGRDDDGKSTVERVSSRIEALRQLKFKTPVEAETLGRDDVAKRVGRELDSYTREEQWKDEELLKILGLLPADASMREIVRSMFRSEIAGFYDPKRDELVVIRDGKGSDVIEEIVLSHELVHALEDQRFGQPESDDAMADDRESARTALAEGTAMAVMGEYSSRYVDAGAALAAAFESPTLGMDSEIPPYVQMGLLFPYEWGERFVSELRKRGGWKEVDRALRNPPESTAEIIHPDLYFSGRGPVRVASADVARVEGSQWRKVASSEVGEFDAFAILKLAGRTETAGDAAAGLAGGSATLWRKGTSGPGSCRAPCISRDVAVLALEFRTATDAAQFAVEVGPWIEKTFHGRSAGRVFGVPVWTARGGGVALAFSGRRVIVVFAPDTETAARVATAE